jgi:hypothetical protein
MMEVMVWHFVSSSHKVMTAPIVVSPCCEMGLSMGYDCTNCCVTLLWNGPQHGLWLHPLLCHLVVKWASAWVMTAPIVVSPCCEMGLCMGYDCTHCCVTLLWNGPLHGLWLQFHRNDFKFISTCIWHGLNSIPKCKAIWSGLYEQAMGGVFWGSFLWSNCWNLCHVLFVDAVSSWRPHLHCQAHLWQGLSW